GNKNIKVSTYLKTVMNQKEAADQVDRIAYTIIEGSQPYVTDKNKESSDFIQNVQAVKDMINFAIIPRGITQ
ncbi:21834_t:CDS:1, partial [Gigaspora rosea]